MGLSGLFSLIAAVLLGLLPVLLLIGRRAAQERIRSANGQPGGGGQPTEGETERRPAEKPRGEPSAVDRIHTPEELAAFTRIIRAGREETESDASARRKRALTSPGEAGPSSWTTRDVPHRQASPRRGSPARDTAVAAPDGGSTGIRSARLAELSDLQRAFAWSEILGPPVSLRRVSGRGAIGPVE